MKLRQKLAVVLASAMVATSVPVVTMAASNNGMLRETLRVQKDEVFHEYTTAGGIQVQFKDAWQGKEEIFYLTLENAEWNKEALVKTLSNGATYVSGTNTYDLYNLYNGSSVDKVLTTGAGSTIVGEFTFSGTKTLKVKLNQGEVSTSTVFQFPLLVTAKGGDAKVKLQKVGSTSTVTDGEWVFATTADKKLSFTAADAEVIYETGVLADVTFAENFKGAFAKQDKAWIEYEIQNGDYEFDFASKLSGTDVTLADGEVYTAYNLTSDYVKVSYGFVGKNVKVTAYVNKEDKGICVFGIDANGAQSDSIGKITLKNIPVRNDAKEIEEGDLLVDIKNFNGTEALGNVTDDVKLAKVVAYSTYIEMKDEKPVEIVAGRTETIEFTVGENIDDSIVGDREIEIVLDKDAHFNYTTGATLYVKAKGLKDGIVQDQTEYVVNTGEAKTPLIESIKVDKENNNKLIVKLSPKAQINEEKDEFTLKLDVCVPVASKDEEKVTITASGRALENECSTTAVTIKSPFDVKMEEMRVKVGLQNQVGGKVTITETDKAMFMKGDMHLSVVDPATGKEVEGITFYGKDFVTFETSADLKKADLQTVTTNGAASIKINRQSKAASTIDLSDFHVTVDRTVPEGKYDLVISGTAIDEHAKVAYVNQEQADLHKITVKDFFVVGTPNTEDIASNGLRRGTVTFVIDESKYVANGIEYTMDAKSYIQDPGFTMVPVRYVAEAFGVSQRDILFSNSTATIFAGERTIQLKVGSDIAIVNGAQIKMATKVAIKNDRIYAPIGEIATILGVKKDWTPETKTATFINE